MRILRLFAAVTLLLTVLISAAGMNTGRTARAAAASLTLTPNALLSGADNTLVVTGSDFTPDSRVTLRLDRSAIGAATANGSGSFTTAVAVPSASIGEHMVSAKDAAGLSAGTILNVVSLRLSTSSAPAGAPVTIAGEGFLPNQALTVRLGGVTMLTAATSASGTFANLSFVVPAGLSGPQVLTVQSGSPATFAVSTTLTVGQATLQLHPNSITAGNALIVSGAGYASTAVLAVTLDGRVLGSVTSSAAGEFGPTAVALPAGVANGSHIVSTQSSTGHVLARATLVVHVPAATLVITPNSGLPTMQVTATGAGFYPGETVLLATNGATLATAVADAQGQIGISFALPAHLPAGNTSVQAIGQSSHQTAAVVAVGSPARISLNSGSVRAGDPMTISGTGFAALEPVRLSIADQALATVAADGQGAFTTTVTIPITASSAVVQFNAAGQQSQRAASTALTITAVPAGITASVGSVFTLGSFTVAGSGFHPGEQVLIGVPGRSLATVTANGQGAFTGVPVTLPAGITPGILVVSAAGQSSQKAASTNLAVQARTGSVSISPATFTSGTQVRIDGSGFAAREEIALAVNGGAPFATVVAGSDGSFAFSHTLPATLAVGSVKFTASGLASYTVGAVTGQMTAPVPANLGSNTWYFAGGRTDSGYHEQIAVFNPQDRPVQGTITFNYGANASSVYRFELAPQARGTYDANQIIGNAGRMAGVVQTSLPVVVARATVRGSAEIMPANAVTSPSRTWYMAEGYTGLTFQEELDLFNPTDQTTNVRVVWPLFNGKPTITYQVKLAPHTQQTIPVNAQVDSASHATIVTADQPIVASRTMLFGTHSQGAFTSVGAASTGTALYFAEGSTNNGFEQYLTILNPDSKPARVSASFFDRQGNSLGSRALVVEPMRRATIKVNEVTTNTAIATLVQSSSPIVAERSMYFGAPNGGSAGGTVVFGQAIPAMGWSFANGDTRSGNSQFELLFNPNRTASTIEAAYYTDDGQMVRKTFTVPGYARLNIDVTQAVPELPRGHHSVVLRSTNGVSFIAEQAIYSPGMASGGATIGTPIS